VPKTKFQNIIDELFKDTNKTVDRKNNEIQFIQNGEALTPYQLSSGEKQMLVIMMTVLLEDGEHCALLMDEPEISLHVEWQKALLGLIRELNPNAQVILSTHSPALIMDGWMDLVTEVEDVTVNDKDA
jgi:predicted ATPase